MRCLLSRRLEKLFESLELFLLVPFILDRRGKVYGKVCIFLNSQSLSKINRLNSVNVTIESSLQLIWFLGHCVITFFPEDTFLHVPHSKRYGKCEKYIHRTLERAKRENCHCSVDKWKAEDAQLVVAFRFSRATFGENQEREKKQGKTCFEHS